MGLEIVPEWAAEDRMIGRRAGPHRMEEAPPRPRHATAEPVEIQSEACDRIQQRPGRLVQREPAGQRFLEHALADEMPQHPVQGIGIGAGCRG